MNDSLKPFPCDQVEECVASERPTRCAFISLKSGDFEGEDDPGVAAQLARAGWDVANIDWKDGSVDWNEFDLALMRSPWDYHLFPEEFKSFLERMTDSNCRLLNDPELVRFNMDKRYLVELAKRCDVVIPTLLWESGQGPDVLEQLRTAFASFRADELVIKPTIGAGSDRTIRVKREKLIDLEPEIRCIAADRDLLIQPFLQTIAEPGEFSLIFIQGEYFHSILKRPKRGDFRVQSQHGGIYERTEPDPWLISTARELLRSVAPTALYARLDWVQHPEWESPIPYLLMEMELIEPDLYLRYTSQGIAHFANAILRAERVSRPNRQADPAG